MNLTLLYPLVASQLSRSHCFADSSELLPCNWNACPDTYSLLYVLEGEPHNSYILTGQLSEEVICMRLLNTANQIRISAMTAHVGETVQAIAACRGAKNPPLGAQLVLDRVLRELFNPVYGGREQDARTQTIPTRLLIVNRMQNKMSVGQMRHAGDDGDGVVFPCEEFQHVWPVWRTDQRPLSRPAGRQESGELLQTCPVELPPREPFEQAPPADAEEAGGCVARNAVAEKCARVIDRFEREHECKQCANCLPNQ